ncbi:polysaccharide deacetylase family protein [Pollutibacter soli]|uniref:polysaccharide deacetylase family protein n=1 Tax=Pollutibacter soli TaxID=3034157 RepID=UPI003014128F
MKLFYALVALLFLSPAFSQPSITYAEKLGYPKGTRVVIMHVDDVGMSLESNQGAIETMTKGSSTSCSIMMPCSWVPGYFHFLKEHPDTDAGLHLTLTSEWKDYRWGPVSGKSQVPGLVDSEGALWPSVQQVAQHASPDEVDKEIRAQVEKCLAFGFKPTHFDSHMGTLFATPAFLEKYIRLGIDYKTPIMFPGGHNTLIIQQLKAMGVDLKQTTAFGEQLWNAGLPVIDDLQNESYAPHLPAGVAVSTENLKRYKTEFYINALKNLRPGITYFIMHCTKVSPQFDAISNSGPIREGDYLAMMSDEVKAYIKKEGIILTTMRELMERRSKVK